ncbi:hypothetical protein V5738_17275 [Salinisphaera sp. SPP-AMP-43]|uniref:hypothetical protein n=1 Tax=Salinisphaera sp. SPP-AMP-43 TaxID=3121288 RepID=UPI003C6DD4CA
MTLLLVVVGVLAALGFAWLRQRRATRLKFMRADASKLSHDDARERYQAICQQLGNRIADPQQPLSHRAIDAKIEQAMFYYERMIELETGHAGPAVRLSIRPTLRRLRRAATAPRLPKAGSAPLV